MNSKSDQKEVSWTVGSGSVDNFIDVEKQVWKNSLPLVLASALCAGVYSYFMINRDIDTAINRALTMALSTFFASSLGNMLEMHGYLDPKNGSTMYVEAGLIPVFYYLITKRQLKFPDAQSEVLKTGVISMVLAELATPTVTRYVSNWGGTSQAVAPSKGSKG